MYESDLVTAEQDR